MAGYYLPGPPLKVQAASFGATRNTAKIVDFSVEKLTARARSPPYWNMTVTNSSKQN
jgi:hypothetical protein